MTTEAGSDPFELDQRALGSLKSVLVECVGEFSAPLEVRLLSGGKSNLTYEISDGARSWVLRRPPLGEVPRGAHDVHREFRVMKALASSTVPVPPVLVYCAEPEVLGAPFYVMDRVAGDVLRRPEQVAGLSEQTRHALGLNLVDTLADLHDVDPQQVGLESLGRPEGYLQRQLDRWVRQYNQIRTRDLPDVEHVAAALSRTLPVARRAAIVHGDFRLDNVIVATGDASRIEAVLDWEMCTLGDPLADLGTFLMFHDEGEGPYNPITNGLTAHEGFPSRDDLTTRYLTRRELRDVDLAWYVTFAEFRLAVILEQIHARHVAGGTPGAEFAGVGGMVQPLLEQARARLLRRA